MKRTGLLLLLAAPCAVLAAPAVAPKAPAEGKGEEKAIASEATPKESRPKPPAASWQVVFRDEFNGAALDASKWSCETGTGFEGWGNWEQQYYRDANAVVSDGMLKLVARKETFGEMPYTSARISTKGKFAFQYGKVRARIKFPTGKGLWPAFWMLGATEAKWPACGEIDIMEAFGADTISSTCHWLTATHVHGEYGKSRTVDASAFHVYELRWDASTISAYVDGEGPFYKIDITTADISELRDHTFYLVLNLAVGGLRVGNPDAKTPFPSSMDVDWVEVQQFK